MLDHKCQLIVYKNYYPSIYFPERKLRLLYLSLLLYHTGLDVLLHFHQLHQPPQFILLHFLFLQHFPTHFQVFLLLLPPRLLIRTVQLTKVVLILHTHHLVPTLGINVIDEFGISAPVILIFVLLVNASFTYRLRGCDGQDVQFQLAANLS